MLRDRIAVTEWATREHERRRLRGAPLVSALHSRLPHVKEVLRNQFGVQRVLIFGSFAQGTPEPSSDVDLAVEGLPARDHFRAMACLARILGRDVDLIRLEDLESEDRLRLLHEAIPA